MIDVPEPGARSGAVVGSESMIMCPAPGPGPRGRMIDEREPAPRSAAPPGTGTVIMGGPAAPQRQTMPCRVAV